MTNDKGLLKNGIFLWRLPPLKIVVCLKQVPAREAVLKLNAAGTWIETKDVSFEVNEPDIFALEEALRLKEKHTGEVVICSLGRARVAQAIKEALAARDGAFFVHLAQEQRDAGAHALDLNIGPQKKAGPEVVSWLVDVMQEAVGDMTLSFDTTNLAAIETGLKKVARDGNIAVVLLLNVHTLGQRAAELAVDLISYMRSPARRIGAIRVKLSVYAK